jgi:hypothetical protein
VILQRLQVLPLCSLGGQISYYDAKASSTLGPLGTPATTFPKYLTPSEGRPFGFLPKKYGLVRCNESGTRYKLDDSADLLVDLRLQYFSNWVDGLNPNPKFIKKKSK